MDSPKLPSRFPTPRQRDFVLRNLHLSSEERSGGPPFPSNERHLSGLDFAPQPTLFAKMGLTELRPNEGRKWFLADAMPDVKPSSCDSWMNPQLREFSEPRSRFRARAHRGKIHSHDGREPLEILGFRETSRLSQNCHTGGPQRTAGNKKGPARALQILPL